MVKTIERLGTQRTLAMFADWTDRIAAGEVPPAPPRPQGVERNVVITQWDWGDAKAYMHDEIATDSRNPTVNANGLVYSAPEISTDNMPVLDPTMSTDNGRVAVPPQDPKTPISGTAGVEDVAVLGRRSNLGRAGATCTTRCSTGKGRVWMTSRIRPPDNPAFCKAGSTHPSAKLFPMNEAVPAG